MITLVLAFHNHQPVGNFDWVIEDAYQRAYRPLMEVLAEYPEVRFAQHYTGILLDWFDRHHPEFVEMIAGSVGESRLELLSGGYYEPILAMLAERDRHAQIDRLNRRIASGFGVQPTGMWLAERVWEPSLPSTLHAAGLRYTILDDTHFKSAGLAEDALTGYFLTEDQGRPLAVLPIDKRLRYIMPFERPEVTFEYLHRLDRPGESRVVVFADDGEKFGVWPDTHRTVYEHGWLRRFCDLLAANSSWVRTATPGEVVAATAPAGRLYLPTASYAEMLHWALPTPDAFAAYETFHKRLNVLGLLDDYVQYVHGGFWRNFLVKYPEINSMQKKMMRISERLERVRGRVGESEELDRAYDALLAAQCNCPYWHGVFGGIYLANIRSAMYRSMIEAEVALDAIERLDSGALSSTDYDLDGRDELIYEGPAAAFYIAPAVGGAIFEFDYKPLRYNFIDLLSRRREGYHARLVALEAPAPEKALAAPEPTVSGGEGVATEPAAHPAGPATGEARSIHDIVRVKESGLERSLHYDGYRHATFIDHFLGAHPHADDLKNATLDEIGDFVTGSYVVGTECSDSGCSIALRREGSVGGRGVALEKGFVIDDATGDLNAHYCVSSMDGAPIDTMFAVEFAYSMSAGTEPDRYYRFNGVQLRGKASWLDSCGSIDGRDFALVDEWLGAEIRIELSEPATIVRAPIETVSMSEDGLERNYQGSLLLAVWHLKGVVEWRMNARQRIVRPI